MNLLNKTGFYKTLRLLDDIDGKVSLKSFYAKFNEDSYYNAFLRVKKPLEDAQLIKISGGGKHSRSIEITESGKRVWAMIGLIIDTISGRGVKYID